MFAYKGMSCRGTLILVKSSLSQIDAWSAFGCLLSSGLVIKETTWLPRGFCQLL